MLRVLLVRLVHRVLLVLRVLEVLKVPLVLRVPQGVRLLLPALALPRFQPSLLTELSLAHRAQAD